MSTDIPARMKAALKRAGELKTQANQLIVDANTLLKEMQQTEPAPPKTVVTTKQGKQVIYYNLNMRFKKWNCQHDADVNTMYITASVRDWDGLLPQGDVYEIPLEEIVQNKV